MFCYQHNQPQSIQCRNVIHRILCGPVSQTSYTRFTNNLRYSLAACQTVGESIVTATWNFIPTIKVGLVYGFLTVECAAELLLPEACCSHQCPPISILSTHHCTVECSPSISTSLSLCFHSNGMMVFCHA